MLGSHGELLDLGTSVRLFTKAQTGALWLRDRHCNFPGCATPARWCDAHHVVHWADGGPIDLDNAALLCQRHHTIVHHDRLIARLTGPPGHRAAGENRRAASLQPSQGTPTPPPRLEWDVTPGSYDRALRQRHAA